MTGHRDEVAEVTRWAEGIEKVHECIAGRFRRPEPRRRVLDYLRGLLSLVERKNGWQLAEQAGDATPDGVQRLLYNSRFLLLVVHDGSCPSGALGSVDIQRNHSMKLAPALKYQSPVSPSTMLTIWSERTWKS